MDKKDLRKIMRAKRDALLLEERYEKSASIARRVIALEAFQSCNKILLYLSAKGEVDTTKILEAARTLGKQVHCPRVQGKEMEFYLIDETTEFDISPFGITEPKPETTLSLELEKEDEVMVIIPGLAFDREGNRIGYGGGYYDKYLYWMEHVGKCEKITKVAVAYACQMIREGLIENEAQDVRVDYIITEETNEHISY